MREEEALSHRVRTVNLSLAFCLSDCFRCSPRHPWFAPCVRYSPTAFVATALDPPLNCMAIDAALILFVILTLALLADRPPSYICLERPLCCCAPFSVPSYQPRATFRREETYGEASLSSRARRMSTSQVWPCSSAVRPFAARKRLSQQMGPPRGVAWIVWVQDPKAPGSCIASS